MKKSQEEFNINLNITKRKIVELDHMAWELSRLKQKSEKKVIIKISRL